MIHCSSMHTHPHTPNNTTHARMYARAHTHTHVGIWAQSAFAENVYNILDQKSNANAQVWVYCTFSNIIFTTCLGLLLALIWPSRSIGRKNPNLYLLGLLHIFKYYFHNQLLINFCAKLASSHRLWIAFKQNAYNKIKSFCNVNIACVLH